MSGASKSGTPCLMAHGPDPLTALATAAWDKRYDPFLKPLKAPVSNFLSITREIVILPEINLVAKIIKHVYRSLLAIERIALGAVLKISGDGNFAASQGADMVR